MKRSRVVARLAVFGITVFLTACGGGVKSTSNGGSSNSALNLSGTWTVKTVSTQGHGSSTGTAPITQSGQGLGANGATTLAAAALGQISISQTGTALTGTITNSLVPITFDFIGTLSNGNFTITGSTPCDPKTTSESTSITGTITSSSMQGTYTITRPSGCYYPTDAGTFVATKQ